MDEASSANRVARRYSFLSRCSASRGTRCAFARLYGEKSVRETFLSDAFTPRRRSRSRRFSALAERKSRARARARARARGVRDLVLATGAGATGTIREIREASVHAREIPGAEEECRRRRRASLPWRKARRSLTCVGYVTTFCEGSRARAGGRTEDDVL